MPSLKRKPSALVRIVRSSRAMLKAHRLAAALCACFVVLASADSNAAPPEGCIFMNVQGMSFGNYATNSPDPLDTVSTLLYRCPNVTQPIRMELSRGNSGSFRRSMRVRNSVMEYNLYLDAGHSRIWGDGSSGTNVYMAGPTGNGTQKVSIFGRIPPGQKLRAGEYRDLLVLTLLY